MLLLYILVLIVNHSSCTVLKINSNGILLIGRMLKTIFDNKEYTAFYNIPYAEAPVHKLRFKPPKGLNFLFSQDIKDFSKKNKKNNNYFEEDCLYLTVYVPSFKNNTIKYPVLVWAYTSTDVYEPDFLIDEEVLVVAVSFRSSIFGFLNTEDDFAEGNMGAKDILMALKWVHDNINIFNGDPNRVTILGSGVATTSVASMLLSPASGDLLSGAIILDGSALSPADYRPYNFELANKLYWKLKGRLDQFNRSELYSTLKNISFPELIVKCNSLYDSTEIRDAQRLINPFSCSIETNTKYAFAVRSPLEMYERKIVNNFTIMFGYSSLVSLYKLKGLSQNRDLLRYINYNFQYLVPFEGKYDVYESSRYKKIRQRIINFYFVNGTIGERSLRRYAKYISDQIIYPLLRQAIVHSELRPRSVYLYRFAYQGSLNCGWKSSVPNLKWAGATLGDQICYLFKCKSEADVYKSLEEHEKHFIRKFARLFANFVKYRNPSPNFDDNILEKLHWTPLNGNRKLRAMNFGQRLRMIDVPEAKRFMFWEQLRKDFF